MNTTLKVDGAVVVGHDSCQERLAEDLEELYNVPLSTREMNWWGPALSSGSGSANNGKSTL